MEDNSPSVDQDSLCLIWKIIVHQLIKILSVSYGR